MTRRIAVLRPEPGNAATATRIVDAGAEPVRLPLFAIVPLAWTPPDPAAFDALLLTSANAVRHAGSALARYRELPVHAVGEATAVAARAAGLTVAAVGDGGVAALALGDARILHLGGRDRTPAAGAVTPVAVYASEPVAADPAPLVGTTALVHSRRAALRLTDLVADRTQVGVVAISPAVALALGDGWRRLAVADRPDDDVMIALALAD